jgi:hypothetical protein
VRGTGMHWHTGQCMRGSLFFSFHSVNTLRTEGLVSFNLNAPSESPQSEIVFVNGTNGTSRGRNALTRLLGVYFTTLFQ